MGIVLRASRVRALVAAVAMLGASVVSAELVGLAHDTVNDSLRVVSINSASGEVTPGTSAVADCCLMPSGLTAVDETGDRIFAVGEWTGGSQIGNTALFNFALDGSVAGSVTLTEAPRVTLAWDDANDRLISLRLEPEAVLLAIDPGGGTVSAIGGAAVDCCEFVTGMSAIDSAGQQLFVAGRDFGASGWSLLSFDLANGALTTVTNLPAGQPGFMRYDPGSGRVQVLMQTALADTSALVAVDPGTGSTDSLASYDAFNCCLYSPGDVASNSDDGEAVWVAGTDSSTVPGFLGHVASGTDRPIDSQALESGYLLQALVVDGLTIAPGAIFRDRFELP